MTRESKSQKNQFKLDSGLNTEINELGFPDGFTTDETNYEILVDGSRRRRKGLAEEASGASKTVATHTTAEFHQAYVWRNVGGDPSKEVVVYRKGDVLHFADADETVSNAWSTQQVNLDQFSDTATAATVDNLTVTFSQGRGDLFVGGAYVRPFYVEYDSVADTYTGVEILVRCRDYTTVDDGTHVAFEPTGTITDAHRYNLRNRGWSEDEYTTFETDTGKFPARNAIWYKGYERYGDTQLGAANIHADDLPKRWSASSLKMDAEVFGNSSAPKGALFINPRDTTTGVAIAGSVLGSIQDISTWSQSDLGGGEWEVTITTAADTGLGIGDEVTISGQQSDYSYLVGSEAIDALWSMNGTYTVTTASAGAGPYTFKIQNVDEPYGWSFGTGGTWNDQYLLLGQIDTGTGLVRDGGVATTKAYAAVEFHAGRVFYGGLHTQEWADTIFFSQLAVARDDYRKCYQEADPTDETFNSAVATDGGFLVVPGMGSVVNMVSVRDALIVLSRDGIWEIQGGRGGFSATNYAVRKLSEESCTSATGIMRIENVIIYTGPGGIHMISPNQYTGQLEVQNIITQTIQTKWNSVETAEQERCQALFDDAQKRAYFLVKNDDVSTVDANCYNEILVFDTKKSAWYRYTFTANGLLTGVAIPTADDPSNNKKMKFIYEATSTTVKVADFNQTSFDDWDGSNGPLPYLLTGHDPMRDFQRRGQAPIITVFSKRTETGYTESGNGWAGDNTSSTTMYARWDWTENDPSVETSVSNKIGAGQEVYRHIRNFVPAGATDTDGYPVVTTRNKVRGRGRVLQLKFKGATDKDSHILGFTVNTATTRKK